MNKLKELQEEVRTKTLHNRSLEALVLSDRFERLWEASTEEQKEKVLLAVQFGFKSRVLEWIKSHESLDLGERSLSFLRDRGRDLGIKNYSRLHKSVLIMAIQKKEQEYAANKDRNGI